MKLPDYHSSTAAALADISYAQIQTREEQLRDYSLCWQQVLLGCRSARIRSEARTLLDDEACHRLQKRLI